MRMTSRHEKPLPAIEKTVCVSPTIHAIVARSTSRVPSASVSPTLRASGRCACGSRSVRIAMKTRLSMPSTISSAASVTSETHTWGSVTHWNARNSMIFPWRVRRYSHATPNL